jgi:hypothetical protein
MQFMNLVTEFVLNMVKATCLWNGTTTGRPTSDGPILLTSDGQAACHWYAVTGNWLLVTGKIARH